MSTPTMDSFKSELKALLKKYDASIDFSVGECSDTHGLYDARLEVSLQALQHGNRFKTVCETSTLADGWGVSPSDL